MTTGDYIDTVQEQWRHIDPDISSAPAAIVGRIRRLAHLIQLQSDRVLAENGVSRDEFDILALLTRAGRPMTPSELSGDLVTSAAGTTKRINKLVHAGLVTRESNPRDGRGAFIRMTTKGRDLILPILRSVSDYEESVIAFFSEAERDELATLLRSLLIQVEARDS
jgi:DNA-binding MarR family transcriptional regulator